MCGDGANDLMAIKEADAGMGISDTDSSFAANFSIPELKGVEHIIRDGKATLSNVREIFIYYGATSFMKVTSSFVMMYDITYLTGNQITFYNYSGNILLAVLLAFSGPADALSSLIPNDNFMGWENALIYTINWVIPTAGLILSEYFLWIQPFFTPLVASKN
jgi:cation-transporting ATPase 13A2